MLPEDVEASTELTEISRGTRGRRCGYGAVPTHELRLEHASTSAEATDSSETRDIVTFDPTGGSAATDGPTPGSASRFAGGTRGAGGGVVTLV